MFASGGEATEAEAALAATAAAAGKVDFKILEEME